MTELFELLKNLKIEKHDFDLSYTSSDRLRVSVSAGSEHWIIEFSETRLEWVEVFRSAGSSNDNVGSSLENLFNRVQRAWFNAASDLHIEMSSNYYFAATENGRLEAPVFLPEFGSARGTLLFVESSAAHAIDAAHSAGYYVSIISESSYDHYNRAHFVEALREFGWNKSSKNPPAWYAVDA